MLHPSAHSIPLLPYLREELGGNHERAAAIAVFQGHIRRAIACLKDGADAASRSANETKGAVLIE